MSRVSFYFFWECLQSPVLNSFGSATLDHHGKSVSSNWKFTWLESWLFETWQPWTGKHFFLMDAYHLSLRIESFAKNVELKCFPDFAKKSWRGCWFGSTLLCSFSSRTKLPSLTKIRMMISIYFQVINAARQRKSAAQWNNSQAF